MHDKEDSPQRWSDQSVEEQGIWDHYDTIIAPQIVRAALVKKPLCTLCDLYQVLSVARVRCEREKNSRASVYWLEAKTAMFGAFQASGSTENNIYSSSSWGSMVNALVHSRSRNRFIRAKDILLNPSIVSSVSGCVEKTKVIKQELSRGATEADYLDDIPVEPEKSESPGPGK